MNLDPGEDLIESILRYARVANIKSATILSGYGTLSKVTAIVSDRYLRTIVHVTGNIFCERTVSVVCKALDNVQLFVRSQGDVSTFDFIPYHGNILHSAGGITLLELESYADKMEQVIGV